MRTLPSSTRPFTLLALFLSATASLWALQDPQSQPPQQEQAPPVKQSDTGTRLREPLKPMVGTHRVVAPRIDAIVPPMTQLGQTVAFKPVVRDARLQQSVFLFTLQGAPAGAEIDSVTGEFRWTPTATGVFSFNVVATDANDPARIAVRLVTITVGDPLQPFGYKFFEKARAALLARLNAAQAAPTPGTVVPFTTPPATTEAVVTTEPPTVTESAASATTPPVAPPATAAGVQPLPQGQPANALQQVVSPFDMVGANVFVPAPERYQLGPGDLLTLRYWSPTLEVAELDLRVDQFGGVNLPAGGRRVILRGRTLAQSEGVLKKELQQTLKDADLTLALKELRTMSIVVIGEAFLPGNYEMPAVATLFNALYLFGGPSDTGSLRRIELRRTDGTRRVFDLYQFLVFGDASQDVPLQPGDTLFIPPTERRVAVQGEVMRPASYELLAKERLQDALNFAGGVKPTGVSQRISVATVEPGVGRKLLDVDLNATGPSANPPLYDGDVVDVNSVRSDITNLVTVDGAVDQPGDYALSEGMTVADLVSRARGTLREAYLVRADLFRENEDKSQSLMAIDLRKALARESSANPELQVNDRLVVYRFDDVQWMGDRMVEVRGAVRAPGTYYRADNMHIADLVMQAKGLDGGAFAETAFLQRVNPDLTLGDLLKIDLRLAMINDTSHNVPLQDRDVLTVQTMQEATYVPEQTVRILGAVQRPGDYPRSANLTLGDLLRLAGGALPNASETVEVAHARVEVNTPPDVYRLADVVSEGAAAQALIRDGDLVTVSVRKDVQMGVRTVIVIGEVERPGPYAISSDRETISSIFKRVGGLTDRAFPEGAQFLRDPKLLTSPVQEDLSPRVRDMLKLVADDEYKRALAKAEAEKARFIASAQSSGTPALSIPGLGSTQTDTAKVQIPEIKGDLVTPARSLRDTEINPAGNLDVNLVNALQRPGSRDDLLVEDGDVVIVPARPSTVTVSGAVMVPAAVLFTAGSTAGSYIDRAGGFAIDAATDRILVIRARGAVVKASRHTRVELGDIVFVPTKVMAARLTDREAEIDSISKRVTAAGIVFALIRSLLIR